jgi:AcrR family transcriptional regulator
MNMRTPSGGSTGRPASPLSATRRTQAERRRRTRQALLDAAVAQIEAGEGFDALSLRSVATAAGVVPTAFYRHFSSMDELGLTLVEESFRTLRAILRQARAAGLPPRHMIRRSVAVLIADVRGHRQHFAFLVRVRASANDVLRRAIRNEIRLLSGELAIDLGRFPVLREWTSDDLQMLAGLLVSTMIATVEAILDAPELASGAEGEATDAPGPEGEIARMAEKQLRLILLGVPRWRTGRALAPRA